MVQYSLAHLVEWGGHLSVDHAAIDAQREVIFGLVAEVHELWRRNSDLAPLRAAVGKLTAVLEVQFRYEPRQGRP